jgi:integrase
MNENLFFGRPSTLRSQKSLFNNWILPYMPGGCPDDGFCNKEHLNEAGLVRLVNIWQSQDLKPGTIRILVAIFKRYIRIHTGVDVKAPRLTRSLRNANQEPVKAWTKDQSKTALEAALAKDQTLHDLILIGLHTGMRPGEIFGLRGKDINLLNRKLSVVNTKTGKPRTIKMTPQVETAISRYIKPGNENNFLFKGKVPNDELRALCRYAKIPPITFHGLRHTFATLALESGWSPRDVAKVLGHNKVSTTLDYYWQAINDDLEVEFYE